jgi:HAD domain family 1 in Swiss Army Knife RNA repair proteins
VLDIFDFDSTLFMSPHMSQVCSKTLNSIVLAEGAIGPGWWRDINSLTLGDNTKLQQSAWDSYWNDEVVEDAKRSIADSSKLSVMLTGRRVHPFGQIITSMLESKGLQFDIVALRPDPIDVVEEGTLFNSGIQAFNNTMEFKKSFLLDLLEREPSLRRLVMYDDRKNHVVKFEQWIGQLVAQHVILSGKVFHIISPPRGFDPGLELACMKRIVDEHNKRVDVRRLKNETPPQDVEDHYAINTWWTRKATLKPIISSLNIKFTEPDIEKLLALAESSVTTDTIQNAKRFPFVGEEFTLKPIDKDTHYGQDLIKLAKANETLKLHILSIGEVSPDGLALEAQVADNQLNCKDLGVNKLYIPLWCRPALKDQVQERYRQIWTPIHGLPTIMSGHFCLGYTYDIEGDPPLEKTVRPQYRNYHQPRHNDNRHRHQSRNRTNHLPYNKNHRQKGNKKKGVP